MKPMISYIAVFCPCRLPETEEDMVACDICNEWYHVSCEDIPSKVLTSAEDAWFCLKCSTAV